VTGFRDSPRRIHRAPNCLARISAVETRSL
jgi:hypothetical protein